MFGLSQQTLAELKKVLLSVPSVDSVIVFGSRARGDYHPYSDLDISLVGADVSLSDVARIEAEIDDLLLPFRCDINVYSTLRNAALVQNIDREGINLFNVAA